MVKWLSIGGVVAIVLGIIIYSLFSTGIIGSGGGTSKASADVAPDLTLPTMNGELRLSEERGKVVVLYFSFPG